VETRGRGLREKTTLSLFAAARRASSTRHYDGSRDLRSDCDERLASFFALMVGPKTHTAATSTYFNVGTQTGDVNFFVRSGRVFGVVQRTTFISTENTIKAADGDGSGCHTPVTSEIDAVRPRRRLGFAPKEVRF
jgi:hypothetical protein